LNGLDSSRHSVQFKFYSLIQAYLA